MHRKKLKLKKSGTWGKRTGRRRENNPWGKVSLINLWRCKQKKFFVILVVHNVTIRIIYNFNSSNPQMLSLTLVTFWAREQFAIGGCPLHCPYPLDASSVLPSTPSVVKTKNVSTEGKICPLLRTTALTFQLPTEKKGYPSFSEITWRAENNSKNPFKSNTDSSKFSSDRRKRIGHLFSFCPGI